VRAILTYHSIDSSGSAISVSAAQFERHVRWLAGKRVRVVALDQLIHEGDETDAVALTFDDGFKNFAGAANMLLEHGLPATVFVVTRQVGKTNAWGGRSSPGLPELPLLQWEELGRLRDQGISLGAHSRSHPSLATLNGPALQEEIQGSASDLQDHLGVAARTFAYPYGSVSPAAAALVQRTYAVAVTTELRMIHPEDPGHLLPRLDMFYFREPGQLERWGSPAFRRRLWVRATLRRARSALAGRS
jgi:peptidoglycan/xylan/chitin deacetylase (PgdA/CDA1 family)